MEPWEYPDHWRNYTFTYQPMGGEVMARCLIRFSIIKIWLEELEELYT